MRNAGLWLEGENGALQEAEGMVMVIQARLGPARDRVPAWWASTLLDLALPEQYPC